jgi:polyphosphate kinase
VTRRDVAATRGRHTTVPGLIRSSRGAVTRLQVQDAMSVRALKILNGSLGAASQTVYRCRTPLDWAKSIATIADCHARGAVRTESSYPRWPVELPA